MQEKIIVLNDQGGMQMSVTIDKTNTLRAEDHGHPPLICYAIGSYESNAWKSGNPDSGCYETDISKTLDAINCGYPGCQQGGIAVVEIHKS